MSSKSKIQLHFESFETRFMINETFVYLDCLLKIVSLWCFANMNELALVDFESRIVYFVFLSSFSLSFDMSLSMHNVYYDETSLTLQIDFYIYVLSQSSIFLRSFDDSMLLIFDMMTSFEW